MVVQQWRRQEGRGGRGHAGLGKRRRQRIVRVSDVHDYLAESTPHVIAFSVKFTNGRLTND